MSNDIMRSFNSLVKYNNGLFKSEKQAKYLLSKCQEPYKYYGTGHIGAQNWSGSYQLHFSLDDKGVTRVEKCTSKGGCKITWERMSNDKFTSKKKEDSAQLIQSNLKEIDKWEEYLIQPRSQLEELNAFEIDTESKYKSGEYNDKLYSTFTDVIANKRDEFNSDIERVTLNINKLKEQIANFKNVLNESKFIPFLESLRNDINSDAINSIKQGYITIFESNTPTCIESMDSNLISPTNNELSKHINGRFLSKKDANELHKEIESQYISDNGIVDHFTNKKNDIRLNAFNYENPLAEKNVNGVNVKIVQGLIRDKQQTYLLYADDNLIGEFYSVEGVKNAVKYIESLLEKQTKTIATSVYESTNNTLNESVTRDLTYLYKYLKSDDYSDFIFNEPWYIEEYFNDYGITIDDEKFNEYMEDQEWSEAVDWLYRNDKHKFNELSKWMVEYKHDEGQRGYTKLYFDTNPEMVKNHWLLHFTDNAYDVFKDGFDFGTYDISELGLTSYKKSEKGGTFAFAYDAETTGLRTYGASGYRDFKYGQQVVMFRASGVKVYHNTDEEYQVIFDTRTVKDLIVIEKTAYNDSDVWAVTDRKGRPLYKTQTDDRDQLDNAVKWVIKNYDRYHKAIDTGKAPSVKEPSKYKKQFESFMDKLKTDDNLILIEAIQNAYKLLFESKVEYEVPHVSGKSKLTTSIPPSDRTFKNLPKDSKGNAKVKFQHWLEMNPCSHGLGKGADGKWYGWSHRAVYGFGIGDKIKKGDVVYKGKELTITSEKQAKEVAERFSDEVS